MQKFKSKEYEKDCRICGEFNNSPLAIARAVISTVLPKETNHCHQSVGEYYIFLKGKGEMVVDNRTVLFEQGDVIYIEPKEVHKIQTITEETDYITVKTGNEDDKIIHSPSSIERVE